MALPPFPPWFSWPPPEGSFAPSLTASTGSPYGPVASRAQLPLNGSAAGGVAPYTYLWEAKLVAPGGAVTFPFDNPTDPNATVAFVGTGVYVLTLHVTDSVGAHAAQDTNRIVVVPGVAWSAVQVNAGQQWTSVACNAAPRFVRAGWVTGPTNGLLAYSDNFGATWTAVVDAAINAPHQWYSLSRAPLNNLFVMIEYQGTHFAKSTLGAVWTTLNTGILTQAYAIIEAGDGSLVATGDTDGSGCIERSIDAGATWTVVPAPPGVTSLTQLGASPTALIASIIGGAGFAARSTDFGASWVEIAPPSSGAFVGNGGRITYEPSTHTFLAIGGSDANATSAWISTDDGVTWHEYPIATDGSIVPVVSTGSGLPGYVALMIALAVDPHTQWAAFDGKLWLGTTPAIGDLWGDLACDPATGALVAVAAPQSGSTPGKTVAGFAS